jgi:hypothetical protein
MMIAQMNWSGAIAIIVVAIVVIGSGVFVGCRMDGPYGKKQKRKEDT